MSGVTCPYLGIADDAETALAYPSPWNCCFRKGPSESVSLEHQRNYCLATAYAGCSIYLQGGEGIVFEQQNTDVKKRTNIVKQLEKRKGSKPFSPLRISRKKIIIALGLLIGLVFIIWGVVWGKQLLDSDWLPELISFGENPTLTPTLLKGIGKGIGFATSTVEMVTSTSRVIVISDPIPTESLMNTVVVSTKTITITPTRTKQAKETEKTKKERTSTPTPVVTVSCGAPAGWVRYIVKQGDTLSSLSRILGVSIAQLQSANCMGSSTQLYTGTSIYVPFYPPEVKTATSIPTDTSVPPTKTKVPATKTLVPTNTSVPATSTLEPTETKVDPTVTQEIAATVATP